MSINLKEILNTTRELEGTDAVPANYVDNMFAQRVHGEKAKGSIYENLTAEQLEELACAANWTEEYNENVLNFCRSYTTMDIPGGLYGIVQLVNLPDDAKLVIKDNKNTGYASLCVEGGMRVPAAKTWLIIGPSGTGVDVVYTMYPGEPTPKATTPTSELPVGKRLTKAEAIALGFNSANVL